MKSLRDISCQLGSCFVGILSVCSTLDLQRFNFNVLSYIRCLISSMAVLKSLAFVLCFFFSSRFNLVLPFFHHPLNQSSVLLKSFLKILQFEWTWRKVASDNHYRCFCEQTIIKRSLAYSFRKMFFIGQNLKLVHMTYFFLNFWSFFD